MMNIEEKLLEKFRSGIYHPSVFVYAWKKSVLDKLFEELMESNIAIIKGKVWLLQDNKTFEIIPLNTGEMKEFSFKSHQEKGEDWFDFVERSVKDAQNIINSWEVEKNARRDLKNKIWYHFEFGDK